MFKNFGQNSHAGASKSRSVTSGHTSHLNHLKLFKTASITVLLNILYVMIISIWNLYRNFSYLDFCGYCALIDIIYKKKKIKYGIKGKHSNISIELFLICKSFVYHIILFFIYAHKTI